MLPDVGDARQVRKDMEEVNFVTHLLIFYICNVMYLILNNIICSGLHAFYIMNIGIFFLFTYIYIDTV